MYLHRCSTCECVFFAVVYTCAPKKYLLLYFSVFTESKHCASLVFSFFSHLLYILFTICVIVCRFAISISIPRRFVFLFCFGTFGVNGCKNLHWRAAIWCNLSYQQNQHTPLSSSPSPFCCDYDNNNDLTNVRHTPKNQNKNRNRLRKTATKRWLNRRKRRKTKRISQSATWIAVKAGNNAHGLHSLIL